MSAAASRRGAVEMPYYRGTFHGLVPAERTKVSVRRHLNYHNLRILFRIPKQGSRISLFMRPLALSRSVVWACGVFSVRAIQLSILDRPSKRL